MPYKLVGYLKDGLIKTNYLSMERSVFRAEETGRFCVQNFSENAGAFRYDPVDGTEVEFLLLDEDMIINQENERYYLAVYNRVAIFGTKNLFIDWIAIFISQNRLTNLNLFSIYTLLSLRYKIYESAQKVIENNELNLLETLTIQSFSFPPLVEITESEQSLHDILLFYAHIACGDNLKNIFFSLFERYSEDAAVLKLNNENYLVIGNYFIEANNFISHLKNILIGLGFNKNRRVIKKFIFYFLVLFNFITDSEIESASVEEEIAFLLKSTSNQKSLLNFDLGEVEQLIYELNPEKVLSSSDYRNYRALDKQLARLKPSEQ